jgi:hypothetical protein
MGRRRGHMQREMQAVDQHGDVERPPTDAE